ncbi:MAG: DUF4391 domain-containing protein [Candidatus Ancillula sp.]|jgi:hypothetical protein|nr:DUF4391 domain-containing protein [Candidatus Ancillula sp.]
MITLSQSAYVGRTIPKVKFYENANINSKLKDIFQHNIEKITWLYKISPDTMNLQPSDGIAEIEVFEVELKDGQKLLQKSQICKVIDDALPDKNVLFIVKSDDMVEPMLFISKNHKSGSVNVIGKNTFLEGEKVSYNNFDVKIDGNNLGSAWKSFVAQVGGWHGELLNFSDKAAEFAVNKVLEKRKLQAEIDILNSKAKREKQPNKQYEYYSQIKKLENKIIELDDKTLKLNININL